jgi:putative peptidoglycan lipid II flippase
MSLFRAVATIGGNTMISRVLGLVRDMLTAQALGAGHLSDVFVVAQRLPNMFRTIFAEGAFSTAFVPLFAHKIADEGEAAAQEYAERAMAVLLTGLLAVTVLAEAFMPYLIPVIAWGFTDRPEQFAAATSLTRITFPYLLFISLVSLQGGILNSLGKFGAVAFTPVLLNVFMIAAVFWGRHYGHVVEALAWSVSIAGLAQFLWLALSCARAGMALKLPMPRLSPDVRRLLALMAPGVFGASVNQINLFVSTNVASMLPAGSVTYLYYADRLNQLPLAVVGIAVGTAILPALSRQLRLGDTVAAADTQNRGLEFAFLFTLPAAAALAVIAQPILSVLLVRGDFTESAAHQTALALTVYAFALPALVAVKVLVPAFYARQDTRTPVRIAVASLVVNLVLTLILSRWFAHVGNALATSTAAWVNLILLALALRRRGHLSLDRRLLGTVPRQILAAIAMAAVLVGVDRALAPALADPSTLLRILALVGLIGSGLGSYGLFVFVTGAARWRDLKRLLRRQAA